MLKWLLKLEFTQRHRMVSGATVAKQTLATVCKTRAEKERAATPLPLHKIETHRHGMV